QQSGGSEHLIEFWISIKVVQGLASNLGRSTEMPLAQFLMHEYAGHSFVSAARYSNLRTARPARDGQTSRLVRVRSSTKAEVLNRFADSLRRIVVAELPNPTDVPSPWRVSDWPWFRSLGRHRRCRLIAQTDHT